MADTHIKGYIFDIDHTLLNSDKAHIDAALEAFKHFGVSRTYEDVLKYFDKATDEIFSLVTGEDYHNPKEIADLKTELLINQIKKDRDVAPLYPHVPEIFSEILEEGGKIGIVSNNFDSVIEAIIEAYGWQDKVSDYVGIDQVKKRKPHPEMVKKMIDKIQLSPQECAMIGDSIYDAQAGLSAGAFAVSVCTGHFSEKDFQKVSPHLILESISDLYDLLPLKFSF